MTCRTSTPISRFRTRWSPGWAGEAFPGVTTSSPVVARLDQAIQYSRTVAIESRSLGVLDHPLSRGMTAGRCFARGAPALSLSHDIAADSPTPPHPWHRSGPAPHRLGRDRDRRQPAGVRRLRFGGAAGGPAAGEAAAGDS